MGNGAAPASQPRSGEGSPRAASRATSRCGRRDRLRLAAIDAEARPVGGGARRPGPAPGGACLPCRQYRAPFSALPRNPWVENRIGKKPRTCSIGALVAFAASPRARSDESAREPRETTGPRSRRPAFPGRDSDPTLRPDAASTGGRHGDGGGVGSRGRVPARRCRAMAPGETPSFEPLELLGDGLLDDGAEVAVGHRGAHEGSQSLELVVKLGGGGELDPVAAWGEGLDHRGPGPGRGGQDGRSGRKPFDPGRRNSVRTQFGLARGNSVRTELTIDRSTSLRTQSERKHLGVQAESEGRRRRTRVLSSRSATARRGAPESCQGEPIWAVAPCTRLKKIGGSAWPRGQQRGGPPPCRHDD